MRYLLICSWNIDLFEVFVLSPQIWNLFCRNYNLIVPDSYKDATNIIKTVIAVVSIKFQK